MLGFKVNVDVDISTRVNFMIVNLDKPHKWKDDITASVDMYNDCGLRLIWSLIICAISFCCSSLAQGQFDREHSDELDAVKNRFFNDTQVTTGAGWGAVYRGLCTGYFDGSDCGVDITHDSFQYFREVQKPLLDLNDCLSTVFEKVSPASEVFITTQKGSMIKGWGYVNENVGAAQSILGNGYYESYFINLDLKPSGKFDRYSLPDYAYSNDCNDYEDRCILGQNSPTSANMIIWMYKNASFFGITDLSVSSKESTEGLDISTHSFPSNKLERQIFTCIGKNYL